MLALQVKLMRPEGPQRHWNRRTLLPESSPGTLERSVIQMPRFAEKHRLSLQKIDKLGNTVFGNAYVF